jgi:hypothetical protein
MLNSWRITNYALLAVAMALYIGVSLYWTNICAVQGCDNDFRRGYLAPLKELGLYLIPLSIAFLLLPSNYFKAWLIRVASWVFPGGFFLVASINPRSGGWLPSPSRAEVVELLAWLVGIITLLFLLYWRYRNQSKK